MQHVPPRAEHSRHRHAGHWENVFRGGTGGSDWVQKHKCWGAGTVSPRALIASQTRGIAFPVVVQVKEKGYHAGTDTEYDCVILDEDSEDRVRLPPRLCRVALHSSRWPPRCQKHDCGVMFHTYYVVFVLREQLLDDLETMLAGGGVIVDFHSCELFPQRWFDLVLVLRTDNKLLYDRLAAR